MIACTVRKVKDEEIFSALLELLERRHSVKASYMSLCLPRTYLTSIDGSNEKQFESDLRTFASQVGWSIEN